MAENQRADAANSLVYEANLRLRDPVYGCMGVISTLQQQIQSLQAELSAVRSEILRYKYKEATSHIVSSRDHIHPHHHAAAAALVSSGMVSIAAPPQAISTSPPAAPPSSVVFSSSSSTSASSLYTPSTNTTGYSSLTSDNIPYFD